MIFWASPFFLAFVAVALLLCLWQLIVAALAGRPAAAVLFAALIVALSAPVWVNAVVRGEGIPSHDRLAELQAFEDELGGHEVEGDVDELELEAVLEHPVLLTRAPPASSRPPSPYRLLASGEHYDIWRRPADPEGKPVLHHMALGGDGAIAAVPNCSEVVGLGLLALSNQLGLPAQSIAVLGAAPDGTTLAVPPGEARNLCGREWDWIEAVGRG